MSALNPGLLIHILNENKLLSSTMNRAEANHSSTTQTEKNLSKM